MLLYTLNLVFKRLISHNALICFYDRSFFPPYYVLPENFGSLHFISVCKKKLHEHIFVDVLLIGNFLL